MIRFSFVVVGTFIALGIVSAATCPFDIPVVTFAPHQVAGFSWGPVIRPMGDACISRIAVDPANGLDWFVGGANGLYVTRNSGQTWMKPLIGSVRALLLVPGVPALVYVGIGPYLYLSRDSGASWNVIGRYRHYVSSVHVAGGRLIVGLAWSAHSTLSGVYVSNLG